jgi:hypothetical protein
MMITYKKKTSNFEVTFHCCKLDGLFLEAKTNFVTNSVQGLKDLTNTLDVLHHILLTETKYFGLVDILPSPHAHLLLKTYNCLSFRFDTDAFAAAFSKTPSLRMSSKFPTEDTASMRVMETNSQRSCVQ